MILLMILITIDSLVITWFLHKTVAENSDIIRTRLALMQAQIEDALRLYSRDTLNRLQELKNDQDAYVEEGTSDAIKYLLEAVDRIELQTKPKSVILKESRGIKNGKRSKNTNR
jgi:hypothetical protein